ncbi:GNAT family N-acetyltransferase [Variovorax boronicumulans]|uniref:GNAT family N-acetyltransferase n=1 Tax=Variovorax boronicumulans TaxID=436515 RepID=UPI0036F19B87
MEIPSIQVLKHAELTSTIKGRILALCSDAYEEDFAPHFELLHAATHVLAMVRGEVVSHAAWVPRQLRLSAKRIPLSCAYVEAVATPIRLQRRGLGSMVLRAIDQLLDTYDIAALSPSEPRFYARLGWEMWRGPLYYLKGDERVHTPDEEVMIRRLRRSPAYLDLRQELESDWREGDVW